MKSVAVRIVAGLLVTLMLAAPARADEVAFNFTNADIEAVIKYVSDFSNKNFLIDSRVKGRVTIVSPKPLPAESAYDVFLSILEVNGFAAVEAGGVTKIVPMAEGKQKGMRVRFGNRTGKGAELVTQIIPLKHADSQQLIQVLKPLVSNNSSLVSYTPGNMLLLTDVADNVRKVVSIIDVLDVSDAVGVRIMALKYASADKVARTLQDIYNRPTPGQQAVASSPVKVIAHNPGNMLIVIAGGAVLPEIIAVVSRLDVQPETDSGRLQVRYLKHANAEEVAKVINQLVTTPTAQATASRALFSGEVRVVAEPATNALLITADPSDIQSVNRIIDKLDIRRLQVLIESLIVEVTGSDSESLGIEWLSGKTFSNNRYSVVGGQNYGTVSSLGGAVGTNTGAAAITAATAALPQGLTVGVVKGSIINGTVSLGGIVQALETMGDANVLSTPNILTMDNEEAEIVVGQNVPFVTGSTSTQGGVANPFQTIERKDIGLTLKVTPQISEGNTVRLQIYQEISSISNDATLAGSASDLITNKRSVKTVALAQNGEMLVLGGLMREDTSSTVRRVPCIGAMPLIGEPFQATANTGRKTNLMVFLRPRIIRSDEDIRTVTQEKYLDIKRLYEEPGPRGTIIYPRKKKPLPPLPEKPAEQHREASEPSVSQVILKPGDKAIGQAAGHTPEQ